MCFWNTVRGGAEERMFWELIILISIKEGSVCQDKSSVSKLERFIFPNNSFLVGNLQSGVIRRESSFPKISKEMCVNFSELKIYHFLRYKISKASLHYLSRFLIECICLYYISVRSRDSINLSELLILGFSFCSWNSLF